MQIGARYPGQLIELTRAFTPDRRVFLGVRAQLTHVSDTRAFHKSVLAGRTRETGERGEAEGVKNDRMVIWVCNDRIARGFSLAEWRDGYRASLEGG